MVHMMLAGSTGEGPPLRVGLASEVSQGEQQGSPDRACHRGRPRQELGVVPSHWPSLGQLILGCLSWLLPRESWSSASPGVLLVLRGGWDGGFSQGTLSRGGKMHDFLT